MLKIGDKVRIYPFPQWTKVFDSAGVLVDEAVDTKNLGTRYTGHVILTTHMSDTEYLVEYTKGYAIHFFSFAKDGYETDPQVEVIK
jgi:hypothetical protein